MGLVNRLVLRLGRGGTARGFGHWRCFASSGDSGAAARLHVW
jgi:hypothetical protein